MEKEANPVAVVIVVVIICGVIYAGLQLMQRGQNPEDHSQPPRSVTGYQDPEGKIRVPPGVKTNTQERPESALERSQRGTGGGAREGTSTGGATPAAPAPSTPRGGQ